MLKPLSPRGTVVGGRDCFLGTGCLRTIWCARERVDFKKIGETSRYEIERFLRAKINLKIWVKVRKEWRDNGLLLRELGYKKISR